MDALELINTINTITTSKKLPEYDAYAVNTDGKRGVAVIAADDVIIAEKFNKVEIKDFMFSIAGVQKHVVFLFTKEKQLNEHYGMLCLDFLNPAKREKVSKTPLDWFEEWRTMLGDSKKDKMIYDFIGEMAVLLWLQKNNKTPQWDSMHGGTFDITTEESIYEVKTTIDKYDDQVTIHNQFQIDTEGLGKNLYITFVRVEDNHVGESIDSLALKLVQAGFDEDSLEDYLGKKGYYKGKVERNKEFLIHEVRLYLVDASFPKITKDSFVNSQIPQGVIKYEYTISISGISYTLVNWEEN